MASALNNAASGAEFFQEAIAVVTDNLSKIETPGFREGLLVGSSNGYEQKKGVGSISSSTGTIVPAGVQMGNGVKVAAVVTRQTQGRLHQTDNPNHMAIKGRGYFQVEMPTGEIAYTRDGVFALNSDRTLVTQTGYVVAPAITIPVGAEYFMVNRNGLVQAKIPGQVAMQDIGTIEIATFANDEGLRKIDDNLLLETGASGVPITGVPDEESRGYLIQGSYEGSNVNMVSQMTKLISIQNAHNANLKGMSMYKEMLHKLDSI